MLYFKTDLFCADEYCGVTATKFSHIVCFWDPFCNIFNDCCDYMELPINCSETNSKFRYTALCSTDNTYINVV